MAVLIAATCESRRVCMGVHVYMYVCMHACVCACVYVCAPFVRKPVM